MSLNINHLVAIVAILPTNEPQAPMTPKTLQPGRQRLLKAFGAHKTRFSGGAGAKAPQNTKFSDTNSTISSTTTVRVYSREVRSREEEGEEGEWGHSKGSGVPLSTIDWSGRESAMD